MRMSSVSKSETIETRRKFHTLKCCNRGITELTPCWKCLPHSLYYVLYYSSPARKELNIRELLLVPK